MPKKDIPYKSIEVQIFSPKFGEKADQYLESPNTKGMFTTHNSHDYAKLVSDLASRDVSHVQKWLSLCEISFKMSTSSTLRRAFSDAAEELYPDESLETIYRKMKFQMGAPPAFFDCIAGAPSIQVGYLYRHSSPESGWFGGGHTQQPKAERIQKARQDFKGAASWVFLYYMYKKELNQTGELANKDIKEAFESHFRADMATIVRELNLDNILKEINDDCKCEEINAIGLSIPTEARKALEADFVKETFPEARLVHRAELAL